MAPERRAGASSSWQGIGIEYARSIHAAGGRARAPDGHLGLPTPPPRGFLAWSAGGGQRTAARIARSGRPYGSGPDEPSNRVEGRVDLERLADVRCGPAGLD